MIAVGQASPFPATGIQQQIIINSTPDYLPSDYG